MTEAEDRPGRLLETGEDLGDQGRIGATGVDPERGLTTGDLDDAVTKRALASRCPETIVLASEEKIGVVAHQPVLPLGAVSGIVTDPHDTNPMIAVIGARLGVRG
ncbi:hypothetical protein [Microbacterium sp. MYb62]|uniref:hypothetical protein n=1 Tax=Microbacterium sp. MYb62 TaxID=1848690 RepID=UPI002158763E|nr:hypothetical protein [Microbacterium sp. MYb62]